jgi:hypothetical protein
MHHEAKETIDEIFPRTRTITQATLQQISVDV